MGRATHSSRGQDVCPRGARIHQASFSEELLFVLSDVAVMQEWRGS